MPKRDPDFTHMTTRADKTVFLFRVADFAAMDRAGALDDHEIDVGVAVTYAPAVHVVAKMPIGALRAVITENGMVRLPSGFFNVDA